MFKKLPTLSALFILTGCTSYQESFDCPAGAGVGCKSVSTVEQMLERGLLPDPVLETGNSQETVAFPVRPPEPEVRLILSAKDGTEAAGDDDVTRLPEQTMRIWIRGYQDNQDNYHADSVIYTVVRPGEWRDFKVYPEDTSLPLSLKGTAR